MIDLGLVPDDRDALADAVARAQEAGADVLVTLGGASVGDHDLVRSTLLSLGMALDFWKIAMRPGKPLMVGRLAGMHVLGLPGNPASSLVCGLLSWSRFCAGSATCRPPNARERRSAVAHCRPMTGARTMCGRA